MSSPAQGNLDLEPVSPDRKDPYLRLACVNIFVKDQDRSLRFYVDQLGFNLVIDESYESGTRWVAVAPPDGQAVLALITPRRNSEEHKFIGRCRNAVLVNEDVMSKFEEWGKRGVRFHHPPQTTLWGGIFTRFDDLDGNSFSLVSRDDFVREIEAKRRAAAEKLEAERRAAQELEIAKQIQARLFPQNSPQLEGLDYAGVCIQARQVGGDYYDFLDLGYDRLGFVVGDISGKGIGAALLMANLQANLRSQSAIALEQPARFLRSVNQLFCENTAESCYATLVFAEFDRASQRLRYANCGHYAPLVFRNNGSLDRLDSTATVLGLFPEWDCTFAETQLLRGDTLAFYTDGVTDAFNSSGEDFGEERLIDAMRKYGDLSPQSMLNAIVDEIHLFSPEEQHDDITMIIARRSR